MKSVDIGVLPNSVCFSFTPSELAKKLYFYPTWCGHYYCTKNYYMKRESFPPLLIVYVRNGIFHFEYLGKEGKVVSETVLFAVSFIGYGKHYVSDTCPCSHGVAYHQRSIYIRDVKNSGGF